ncbi:MAG: hypothetical protein II881_06090 [Oscillospiraceae bacterium]|nr:hypothetical protein [Oscillospiraceae bacterium]
MMKKPPEYALNILRRLENAGFGAYLVGGGVRDMLLGRRPKDWDVTTSALPEETAKVFRSHKLTGAEFGTVTVKSGRRWCEVTTHRVDGEYLDSRKPSRVTFVKNVETDLARRDFTVNAIAYGLDGALVDPYGGREDIEKRILRAVRDPDLRFREDALRMLRALRFSAELGFEIEENTLAAIERNARLVENISNERVAVELGKILMSDRTEIISLLIDLGVLSRYEIHNGNFRSIKRLPKDESARWAAFAEVSGGGREVLKALHLPKRIFNSAE